MQNYETRKQLEASIQTLASLHGIKREALRDQLKSFLIECGLIKSSTTEIVDGELWYIADTLSQFAHRMENTPPYERGESINFNSILKHYAKI